jgi:hypothetical protein
VGRRTFTIKGVGRRQRPGTRAKDSDRNDVCQLLDTALAEGQLSMEEHRQRVAAATKAATLAELRGLLTDLQLEKAPGKTARRIRGPGWVIAAAVAAAILLVLGGVIGWGVFDDEQSDQGGEAPVAVADDRRPNPGAMTTGAGTPGAMTPGAVTAEAPSGPRLLHSVGGINGLLEQIRKKFGDTTGYELLIYTDYADLLRPDAEGDRFLARWHYEAGTWEGPGRSPTGDRDKVVDLSAFDVAAVLGVMRGAGETMGVESANLLKTWFRVQPADDPTTPEALTVRIFVNTSFGGGFIDLDAAGNVKQIQQSF